MREIVIVIAIIVVLTSGASVAVVPWPWLFVAGLGLTALGFVVGAPTAIVYHVLLYRAIGQRVELPKGWYWSAMPYNEHLLPIQRRLVMTWCYISAAGFVVTVLGILVLVGAMGIGLIQMSR